MKIGRLFGGKAKQEDVPPPASESPKQISSGFIAQKMAERENLYSIIISDDRRSQLEALAFVVHTVNQQHGVTASVGEFSYSHLKPEGLLMTLAFTTQDSRATMPLKLWVEGGANGRKVFLEWSEGGFSKTAVDFMTKEGREDFFSRIAGVLAGRKQSARIERLRNAYLEQAIAEQAGHSTNDQQDAPSADNAQNTPQGATPEPRHKQPRKP